MIYCYNIRNFEFLFAYNISKVTRQSNEVDCKEDVNVIVQSDRAIDLVHSRSLGVCLNKLTCSSKVLQEFV